MPTAAGPLTCCPPTLVTAQPVDGPRDGGLRQQPVGRPLASLMVEQAKGRMNRIVPIDMRQIALPIAGPLPQSRRHNADSRLLAKWVRQLDNEGGAIEDMHVVRLQQRPELPAPGHTPVIEPLRFKAGPRHPDGRDLVINGWKANQRLSPRKV